MTHATGQDYLRAQYRAAPKLNARIAPHRRFGTAEVGWHEWVFDQLALPAGARVPELGCGTGRLWVQNAGRVSAGWQVTLSDSSPGMVAQAQQGLAARGRPSAFAGGSFDAVIANHMPYHVPDRPKLSAEVRRVLRPGGFFTPPPTAGTPCGRSRSLRPARASPGA